MPDVSIFNLGGQAINVKDDTARATASQAQSQVSSISTTVAQLSSDVEEIRTLSRVEISYAEGTETITITTGDHES